MAWRCLHPPDDDNAISCTKKKKRMSQRVSVKLIKGVFLTLGGVFVAYIALSIVKVIVQQTNQIRAYRAIKQIGQAQLTFKARNGKYGSLADLGEAELVTIELAQGVSRGYRFVVITKGSGYVATATPTRSGVFATAHISYFTDETGVVRGDRKSGEEATAEDPPLPAP